MRMTTSYNHSSSLKLEEPPMLWRKRESVVVVNQNDTNVKLYKGYGKGAISLMNQKKQRLSSEIAKCKLCLSDVDPHD